MRLESLISDINQAAYKKITENRIATEEEAKETSKLVGMAALKYGDLSNQASKDYVFDMDRFVSFEGNTGPYILYTIVRIKSILSKYGELEEKYQGEEKILPAKSQAEKDLMLLLTRFNEVMEASFEDLAPHKICQYVYELANVFNRFYQTVKIITEEDKQKQASWISLISLTRDVLNQCIGVLGIEAPERM